jgi:hypothetical protein
MIIDEVRRCQYFLYRASSKLRIKICRNHACFEKIEGWVDDIKLLLVLHVQWNKSELNRSSALNVSHDLLKERDLDDRFVSTSFIASFAVRNFFHQRQDSFSCNFCGSISCLRKVLSLKTTCTSTSMMRCSWFRLNIAFMSIISDEREFIDWDEYTSISKSLDRYIVTQTSLNDVHERASIINAWKFVFFDRLKNSKLIISLSSILSRQFSSFDFVPQGKTLEWMILHSLCKIQEEIPQHE